METQSASRDSKIMFNINEHCQYGQFYGVRRFRIAQSTNLLRCTVVPFRTVRYSSPRTSGSEPYVERFIKIKIFVEVISIIWMRICKQNCKQYYMP